MKLIASIVLACAGVGLVACDNNGLTSNGGDQVQPLAELCPGVTGTGTGAPGGSHQVSLQLDGVPSTVTCDSRVRVTVFGFDRMVADVAATPLLDVVEPVPSAGGFTLHLDTTDFQRIEFQAGVPDSLGYYLDVNLDINGDGVVCGEDLSQDFDATPITFYRFADASVTTSVTFEVNGESCG